MKGNIEHSLLNQFGNYTLHTAFKIKLQSQAVIELKSTWCLGSFSILDANANAATMLL